MTGTKTKTATLRDGTEVLPRGSIGNRTTPRTS